VAQDVILMAGLCKLSFIYFLNPVISDWVFLFRQVPLESYTFYTRSGELKTWVRIPPCRQDNSGYRIMVITPAFQVGDVGSTPVTRTNGLACSKATATYPCKVGVVGSIPIRSTKKSENSSVGRAQPCQG